MVPVLNQIGVHAACVGNHDLDFGVANMVRLTKECNFPWLMSNVLDKATGLDDSSRDLAECTKLLIRPEFEQQKQLMQRLCLWPISAARCCEFVGL